MKLEVKHLSYTIKEHPILRDISFHAEGKEILGIIGPNGCGKSTLLAHISRRLPSEGRVYMDGTAVETISRKAFAQRVAVMMQQREDVAGELLAEDVVLMGRYPYKERFQDYSHKDREIAMAVMKDTGADALIGKKVGEMSGGERQRVWIAKALAQEPDLLLLDEPMNHLDVKYKISLMEELKRFQGTVIIVLHDLSLAARYCDRVLIMKEGQLLGEGATDTVMTESALESLFEIPFYTASHHGRRYIYF